MNKPVSKDATLGWVQGQVEEFLDKKPEAFVALLKDTKLETKLLLSQAENAGVVKVSGSKYSTTDGLNLCESGQVASFENAVNYLDNPKHQEVRNIIEAKLSSK